ncbi:MAG: enoyl-CoA hydratase/isomerase family protein [Dehalococcoidia bacterium]|nr:enoyl-CoA hydratase/isomerase family protein [Dehalococcoidia bacterium]MCA9843076.1 enoyl-CoA hydratase/isomerase family protein [Dehalococcoidia bacterium]MCA9854577.1 enoyl-CoA hydratase/isomerase family protein [Dehalococcoidia bacterium]
MSDTVLLSRDGGIATITLNRPDQMNALNGELLDALVLRGREVAEDATVRCVVVTGAGRAFCAGGDLAAIQHDGLVSDAARLERQEEISQLLHEMPKPTVAAINGAAAGAGLSIALACDFRIAGQHAKLTTAFASVGFSGDFGGTWTLQRIVGPAKARELYLLADVISADEAYEMGVINRVVAPREFDEEVLSFARRLAAGPTAAYARIKANFTFGANHTLSETLTVEARNMVDSAATRDNAEGIAAFLEKREPQFEGR